MFKQKVISVVNLTRPLSNVKNIALIVLAFYISGGNFNLLLIAMAFFSLSFVCSSFYAFNAYSDYDLDKNNKNKAHYSLAIDHLGKKGSLIVFFIFLVLGLGLGFFVNNYFLLFIFLLSLTNFLYSYNNTRFKEKFILDILFGATLTFLFRFLACWFIFSVYLPPLSAILGLVFAKSSGYILYKELDNKYFKERGIKNSITILNRRAKIFLTIFLWLLSFWAYIVLTAHYLTPSFFLLIPIFIPPIVFIYLLSFKKIKISVRKARFLGFFYWLVALVVAYLLVSNGGSFKI